MKKARGRPRGFSEEVVLGKALEAFWEGGFEATSLDDLSAATGLNRPSLYASFGDKEAIYLAALKVWTQSLRASLVQALDPQKPVASALLAFYRAALELYSSGSGRGCMAVCTAPSAISEHPAIRERLADILLELDTGLEAYFRHVQARGGLSPNLDPTLTAQMASAVLHSLAIRARAGQSREQLLGLAQAAVVVLTGDDG